MRKLIPLQIFYGIVAFVVIFNTVISVKNSLFFDIDELPKGKILYSYASPKNDRTLNIYLVKNALGEAIRGEVVIDGDADNVFWQTDLGDVDAGWIDNNSISIDGLALNVSKGGSYDCRRGNSLFQDGAVEDVFIPPEDEDGAK